MATRTRRYVKKRRPEPIRSREDMIDRSFTQGGHAVLIHEAKVCATAYAGVTDSHLNAPDDERREIGDRIIAERMSDPDESGLFTPSRQGSYSEFWAEPGVTQPGDALKTYERLVAEYLGELPDDDEEES